MSGGAYGYLAAKLDAAASDIEQTIRENTRCQPSYKPETLERLREGVACLRRAAVYEYRIDRLLCHDDGEECFHEWLPKNLAELEAETPADLALLVAEVERLRAEKADYEADRLDCARQINDLGRKVEDLQYANVSLKNTMAIRVAAPPRKLEELNDLILEKHQEINRLREAIAEHRKTVEPGDDYCGADIILWRMLDA